MRTMQRGRRSTARLRDEAFEAAGKPVAGGGTAAGHGTRTGL